MSARTTLLVVAVTVARRICDCTSGRISGRNSAGKSENAPENLFLVFVNTSLTEDVNRRFAVFEASSTGNVGPRLRMGQLKRGASANSDRSLVARDNILMNIILKTLLVYVSIAFVQLRVRCYDLLTRTLGVSRCASSGINAPESTIRFFKIANVAIGNAMKTRLW